VVFINPVNPETMDKFFEALSGVQIRYFLSTVDPDSTPSRPRLSISSSPVTKQLGSEQFAPFLDSLLKLIAGKYSISTDEGDKFFAGELDILSHHLYPLCIPAQLQDSNYMDSSVLVKVCSWGDLQTVKNISKSKVFRNPAHALRTLVIEWSVYPIFQIHGLALCKQLIREHLLDLKDLKLWIEEAKGSPVYESLQKFSCKVQELQ
jgi:hypothetical protein